MNSKDRIPTYAEAVMALKTGDDDTVQDAIFAFEFDDGLYISRVREAIYSLLKRHDLTPRQIIGIGRVLHGIDRLPLRTMGLDIHISLSTVGEGGAERYELTFDSDRFSTDSGGYVKGDMGSDSFSGYTFQVEAQFRDYDGYWIYEEAWPTVFSKMLNARLCVEDDSDDQFIDWEHEDSYMFWEWISNHA